MTDLDHIFWAAVRGEVPAPPAAQLLGWKVVEAEPDSGRITIQFEVDERFTNPQGDVQGGFVSAMLDDTMGPACGTTFETNETCITLELKVSFLRAAKPGRFTGTGRVVQRGRSVAFLAADLHDADGRLVATATSTARMVKIDPAALWAKA